MHPVFTSPNTVLITGGGSGIGLAIARICASHNLRLLLADINAASLSTAAASLAPADVETLVMDVGDAGAWKAARRLVEEKFGGRIDFLVLNAAVGGGTEWTGVERIKELFNTNVYGVLNGISEFLPVLQQNTTPSSIVIVGSKQGITNPPSNPGYNASKAAIKSIAEGLSFDVRSTPISVHLLVPGWTHTGLTGAGCTADGTDKPKPPGAWTPQQVAERLVRAMDKGDFYVVCPDNETTEEMDRKRMQWAAADLLEGRPALSRWRPEWKGRFEAFMAE